MRIRTQLLVLFLSLALAPLLAATAVLYVQTKQALSGQALSHLESVSRVQAARVRSVMRQNHERVALVTSRTQLRLSLREYQKSDDEAHARTVERILRDAQTSIEDFKRIDVYSMEDKLVASTSDEPPAPLSEDELARARAGIWVNEPLSRPGGLMLRLAGPLSLDGELLGVVVIESSGAPIEEIVHADSGLGETGETTVVRATNDGGAEFVTPLRFDPTASLHRVIPAGTLDAPSLRAAHRGTSFTMTGVDYRGHDVLAAGTYVEEAEWGVVAKIDTAEAFAPVADLESVVVVLMVGLLLVVSVLATVASHPIAHRIAELQRVAHDIRAGDFTRRADADRQDELGELARAFNDMAVELEGHTRELRAKNADLEEEVKRREDLETEREEVVRMLQRKNAELEQFTYTVSHDLKSPIVTVRGFAGVLREDIAARDAAAIESDLRRIEAAAERMHALLDNLLALSRAGRVTTPLSPVDIGRVVCDVLERVEVETTTRGVKVEVSPGLGDALGDALRIGQVFQNLLSNAVKFSGDVDAPRVEIGAADRDGARVFYVRDNGIGIAKEHQARVFGLFERLDPSIAGTGVGLAISKRIVEAHGGRLWVESDGPGAGATFYFSLPTRPDELRASLVGGVASGD